MTSAGPSEARTQGAGIAALFRRLRTQHRAASAAVSVVAIGVGAFSIATPSAEALVTRQLQTQITGTCPAPGNCPAAERIPFSELENLSIDSADHVWVADRFNHAVDRFSSAGAFEAQNTGTGSWEESRVRRLAFSAATNEVFVVDEDECALWGLEAATAAASAKKLTPSSCPSQIAADNSAGGSGGDLYVSNGTNVLRIKASDGSADNFTAGPGAGTNELAAPFTSAGALAVAPDGTFYVGGENALGESAVFQFEPSGEFTGVEITEGNGQHLGSFRALAVAPGGEDLIVADGNDLVYEFEPSGTFLHEVTKPGGSEFRGIEGLAVDSAGHLYVGETSSEPKQIDVFGLLLTLPDVATGAAEVHSTTTATLHGEVNPAGLEVTECFFEYGPTTAYGETAQCEPEAASLGEGTSFEPVEAQLENLTPGTVYHYRLLAANAEGTNSESEDREFITGATIDATSASEVTATTAVLETEVNPRGLPTTYSFQYGLSTAYGSQTPMPPAPLGEGEADVLRSAFISGLQPSTTYHFRVLATNALGTVEGPDRTITTQPASASTALPDGRGYELVSPPLKHGSPLGAIAAEGGVIQAAADGSAITYFAAGSIVSEPAGDRSGVNSQDLSTRTPSGWSTADITTPNQHPVGLIPGKLSEYQLFSSDLSHAAVQPIGATPLSPAATERTPYLRESDGSFNPLVWEGNVPFGTHFGGIEQFSEAFSGGVTFQTATPDLSRLIVDSPQALTSDFGTGFEPKPGQKSLYAWSAGALALVSWIPSSGSETRCGGEALACVPASNAAVGNGNTQVRNAISADGSRVFFTNANAGAGSLYLRDLPRGETLLLDGPQEGAAGKAGAATFQYASADGRRVFFTDAEHLTADSTAAPGKPDLYMCEIEVTAGHLACALHDLTANALNPLEPADVQGAVIGAPSDAPLLYFVANGALSGDAVHGDCGQEASQSCNLYRYDLATQSTHLVAVLSGADNNVWAAGSVGEGLSELTARVSPNGRYLAFMSQRSLTGYDNRDAASGERDEEVFLYDAAGEGGAGTLFCASCNPSGARPHGARLEKPYPGPLVDGPQLWQGRWVAANVPGWTTVTLSKSLYQSRYLSDSGRLFFNAADALVPADTNATEDVYQFEPAGVGGCTEASSSFAPRNGGCLDLISSGESGEESAFMDASETGDDVFFLTQSRLTAKDEDSALDLYDARSGGGEAPPVKPVECSGDACQQPAVPPNDATPGSLTFQGAGNLKECPKGKVKKGGKCVAKHHKKKHSKKKNSKRSHRAGGGK